MAELVQLAANHSTIWSLHKDMIRIARDMTVTYIIQRRLINLNPPVALKSGHSYLWIGDCTSCENLVRFRLVTLEFRRKKLYSWSR